MKICIYGASSTSMAKPYFDAARQLGALIAGGGHTLVFGGGANGLMGACAEGAFSRGGDIIGIAPRFFDEPGILYPGCTRFIYTETMRERKQAMEEESDAFIVLPGGIGTYEEFFEMLTLKQLGRHAKPMAMLNTCRYYDALMAMLKSTAQEKAMSEACFRLFSLCDTPEEVLDAVLHAEQISGSIHKLQDYSR